MSEPHSKEEILALMANIDVAVFATSEGGGVRTRMMHYATGENFHIYLASMKGDPKTVQVNQHPSVSLLIYQSGADINESKEVEITGKAQLIESRQEREQALEMTAKRSPVVKYLVDTGNSDMLDCIKVVPDTVKFRIFGEIANNIPPTVIEFPSK